jgi:hypothetical protein
LKIGIISDTHGIWRPRVAEVFCGVDEIVHAGDVGASDILEKLKEIAPVLAVRGNVDNQDETAALPGEAEREFGGVRFLVRHIGSTVETAPSDLKRLLELRKILVFVFGHSHKSYAGYLGQTLFFNPGAAGPRRFSLPLSVATMKLENGKISWQFWPLEG